MNKLNKFTIVAALSLFLFGCGGGGGGGDDDSDNGTDNGTEQPTIIPEALNFLLSSLPGDKPLIVSAGSDLTVQVDFNYTVFGGVILTTDADNNVTFNSFSTRNTDDLEVTVSSDSGSPLDGTFFFIVTEKINTNIGEDPNSGVFEVRTATETVTVTIFDTGVEISLNLGMPIAYTWDDFTDILDDDTKDTWQRRASLAAGAYELIYELALGVADSLDELETVVLTNPIVEPCDMFTGIQPDGVLAQGETTITWLGSGEVKPGDSFEWRFADCWSDDPSDDTDELIGGVIRLENYRETIDWNTNFLFEIGFGSLGNGPGGVFFDDLKISETQEDMGVFTIDPEDDLLVNGGFVLIFQQY